MKVKICGLTGPVDARAAVEAGADLVGFVFVPGTPRAVDPSTAGWIRDLEGAETVGVFRDAALEEVLAAREALGLDWVQLHGSEPDGWLETLGRRVLRRVSVIDAGPEWERVETLAQRCLPLVDPGAGDGVAPAWEGWDRPPAGLSFALAGGLGPGNVAAAARRLQPVMVDVASGVEMRPGFKDHGLMRAFVGAVREVDGEAARKDRDLQKDH